MAEPFDVGKLIRGFNPFMGANFGKLIYYLAIVCACLGVFYVLFIRPTNRETQKAGLITNTTIQNTESAFELQLIPPRIQVGGFKFKLFK